MKLETLSSVLFVVSFHTWMIQGSVTYFGPGLSRFFSPPVRYFYFNIEEGGRNLTAADFAKGDIRAWVAPTDMSSAKRIRAATDVTFHSEFSGVVRFRLLETVFDGVNVHIIRNSQELDGSPVRIRGPLYHDDCYCPFNDLETWYKALKCPQPRNESSMLYEQIFKDLKKFEIIDMKAALRHTVERLGKSRYTHSFCHYVILNNRIYRKCYGEHVGFNMFSDETLLSLARKVKLPDMDFIINLGDWPLSQTSFEPLLPIISWCGSQTTADIILPTYDLTQATLQMLSRVSLDMFTVRSNTGPAWEKKQPKAFWRGRDSRQERLDLVKFSRDNPDLVDANLTHVFFFRDKLNELEPLAKSIPFYDFFNYKYQINVDGTVAAYRLPYLLSGDSVVLKQESEYWEHFYNQLQPWIHYIPLKHDLTDLKKRLMWVKEHDKEAQQIAKNAQEFTWNNLLPHHILCYHGVIFEEYSKRLTSKPTEDTIQDMDQVYQPESNCQCFRNGATLKSQHNEL